MILTGYHTHSILVGFLLWLRTSIWRWTASPTSIGAGGERMMISQQGKTCGRLIMIIFGFCHSSFYTFAPARFFFFPPCHSLCELTASLIFTSPLTLMWLCCVSQWAQWVCLHGKARRVGLLPLPLSFHYFLLGDALECIACSHIQTCGGRQASAAKSQLANNDMFIGARKSRNVFTGNLTKQIKLPSWLVTNSLTHLLCCNSVFSLMSFVATSGNLLSLPRLSNIHNN